MILPPMSSISPSLQQKTFNPAAATAAAAGQGQGSPKLFHNSSEGRYTSFNEGAASCGSHRGSQSPQQRRLSQIMEGSHSPQQRRLSQMLEQQEFVDTNPDGGGGSGNLLSSGLDLSSSFGHIRPAPSMMSVLSAATAFTVNSGHSGGGGGGGGGNNLNLNNHGNLNIGGGGG